MILASELYYFVLLAALFILLLFFFYRTLKMMKRKRIWASCRNSTYLLMTLFILAIAGLIGANVLTYHRLTHETHIASLYADRVDSQHYQVDMLLLANCHKSSFLLQGDEWQVDARIIKWHGWANLLGLDAAFQLDRIAGRYSDIEKQRTYLPTVFALEERQDFDLWALKKKYQWLPWLDAKYGQSVFLRMKHKQYYQIYMTQSGLIAREKKLTALSPTKACPTDL